MMKEATVFSLTQQVLVRAVVLAVVLMAVLAVPMVASAHERRDVSNYRLTVGFMSEPVYEGVLNGVDFRVQTLTEPPVQVSGLEKTVQVEITHVPTGKMKTVPVSAVFNAPGRYTAPILPTAPGRYQFRFFGTIEGKAIDEKFVSGPNTFNDVNLATDVQFPDPAPQMREITGVVSTAQRNAQAAGEQAQAADDAVASARRLAIIGIALGAIGAAGVVKTVLAQRRS